AGLGELRTALEGVQVPAEPVLLFGGGLLLERLARFGREPQLEYLPRRHRVLTADHHDVPEYLFEQVGLVATVRGRPGKQPVHEPAGPGDADEPDQPHFARLPRRLAGLRKYLRYQLDPARSLGLPTPPARRVHL